MPWWAFLAMWVVGGYCAYQVWRGFKVGKVQIRGGHADRTDTPVAFWFSLTFYGVGGFVLPVAASWVALSMIFARWGS